MAPAGGGGEEVSLPCFLQEADKDAQGVMGYPNMT